MPAEQTDRFITDILGVTVERVKYSHFWSAENGDFEYSANISLGAYLADGNSFILHADSARLDREYRETVIIASQGSSGVWLTVSIAEGDMDEADIPAIAEWLLKLRDDRLISSAEINYEGAVKPLFVMRNYFN